MRGFKRDEEATKAAGFADPRSFISMPKHIVGETDRPLPHCILYGEDKSRQRIFVFDTNRRRHKGWNACESCGKTLWENTSYPPDRGEWHHIRSKAGERCDCVENSEVRCRSCHREEHVQTQFGRTEHA